MFGVFRSPRLSNRALPVILGWVTALTWVSAAPAAWDPSKPGQDPGFSLLPEDTDLPDLLDHTECIGGTADGFPCLNVDFLHQLTPAELGGSSGNDIWGWTDPLTGNEYALMGLNNGTAFVDVTDPEHPEFLGTLPTHTSSSSWRDVKVFSDHAFIVSEASGHGMQVFDLTQLRSVTSPPATFSNTAHYDDFGNAHNIVINEDTGFAYGVGTSDCSGGLHMVDIQDPLNPTFAGCFSADGYTHDAQCVIYTGPDTDHQGQEICFNSNEDTLTIVDVTNKAAPVQLSRTGYTGTGYTHQGWLTEDQVYFLLDDELDEGNFGHNTRTYIVDVTDLDAPQFRTWTGGISASDHNQYVKGQFTYQANYRGGLRILDITDIANGNLTEVAYFDVVPGSDSSGFSGAWSVYPYFDSGTVIVSSIEGGLFVLRPILCEAPVAPVGLAAAPGGDQVIDLTWSAAIGPAGSYNVYRSFGACPGGAFTQIASGSTSNSFTDDTVSGQVEYSYYITEVDESGFCESLASDCASTSTTGACNAPPAFAGIGSVENPGSAACRLDVEWSAATPNCGPEATYAVYRGTTADFVPAPENRVANGLAATSWSDSDVESGVESFYVVRATDSGSGTEDQNSVVASEAPSGPISDGTLALGAEIGDPQVIFTNGFDGGDTAFFHVGWEPSDARAHSGDRSYFSTYANNQCTAVETPPVQLTAGESSQLSFWTLYEIEDGWDGGVVQISDDGGATWDLLTPDQGYPGSFIPSSDACGFLSGDPSFTDVQLTWTEYTADLSPWNGQEIRVRWLFSTDGGLTLEGWYLDDLSITHAEVSGACTDGLFSDGFESGDTSAWTSLVTP